MAPPSGQRVSVGVSGSSESLSSRFPWTQATNTLSPTQGNLEPEVSDAVTQTLRAREGPHPPPYGEEPPPFASVHGRGQTWQRNPGCSHRLPLSKSLLAAKGFCQEEGVIPLPSQVRVLIWNPGAGIPGGFHQNVPPPDVHTSPSPGNLHRCTSALNQALTGFCSHGNPSQAASPPSTPAHITFIHRTRWAPRPEWTLPPRSFSPPTIRSTNQLSVRFKMRPRRQKENRAIARCSPPHLEGPGLGRASLLALLHSLLSLSLSQALALCQEGAQYHS